MEAEKKNASPTLSELLRDYMNLRKAERRDVYKRQAIDQTLIDEMRPAYENFIFNGNYREAHPYLGVYNLIGRTLGTQASGTSV